MSDTSDQSKPEPIPDVEAEAGRKGGTAAAPAADEIATPDGITPLPYPPPRSREGGIPSTAEAHGFPYRPPLRLGEAGEPRFGRGADSGGGRTPGGGGVTRAPGATEHLPPQEAAEDTPSPSPRDLLQDHWGYTHFRPGQERIIHRVLRGHSTLAVMPTGTGKSLCYQLPSQLLPGVTLVLSPLVALMRDQQEGLPVELRASSVMFDGSLEAVDVEARLQGITRGFYRMVYAAPERLRQRRFVHALRSAGVSLLVVDEAHCISLWGHDFRPDYRFIGDVLASLGDPPVLAVTATATDAMQEEICTRLRRRFEVVNLGAYRPNLELSVLHVDSEREKPERLLEACRRATGPTLIYVPTRASAEQVQEFLAWRGLAAGYYHAGMVAEDRTAAQAAFMAGETRVLAATIAFGMGIDKPDIRQIIHFGLPGSLETYHQEIGRAGRDGLPAHCLLIWTDADRLRGESYAREDVPAIDAVLAVRETIGRLQAGGDPTVMMEDLERETELPETEIRTALSVLEEAEALRRGFDVPRSMNLYVLDAGADPAFTDFVAQAHLRERQRLTIETWELCERVGMAAAELEERLLAWAEREWIDYGPKARAMWLEPAPVSEALAGDYALRARVRTITARMQEEGQRRLAALIDFVQTRECRHVYITRYFDQPLGEPCGHCDRCRDARRGVTPGERSRLRTSREASPQPPTSVGASPHPPAPPPPTSPCEGEAMGELPVRASPVSGEVGGGGPGVRAAPASDPGVRAAVPQGPGPRAGTDPSRVVLECIEELPFPLSRGEAIRLLVGAPDSPVLRDRARHFGALAPLGVAGVAVLLDELLRAGQIIERRRLVTAHLQLTQAGRRALRAPGDPAPATYDEPAILEQLLAWRQAQARAERRFPYFVLTHATLRAIARRRPRTVPALMAVPGVGVERGRAYGPDILRILWPPVRRD